MAVAKDGTGDAVYVSYDRLGNGWSTVSKGQASAVFVMKLQVSTTGSLSDMAARKSDDEQLDLTPAQLAPRSSNWKNIIDRPLTAYRLRVDYQSAPLAIDNLQPRFSWSLAAAEGLQGVRQTAYQMIVTNRGTGVVIMDTQRVASNATAVSPLQLSAVHSDVSFAWSITVWAGAASHTVNSTFGTGPVDWKNALWIGGASLLRRSFTLPAQAVQRGILHIACPGYCVVSINGKAVTDAVLGHQTVYERTVLYDTHDVATQLKQGNNTIGIEVGNGWYGSFEESCKQVAASAQDCTAAEHSHSNPHLCLPYCWQQHPGQLGNRSVMVLLSTADASGATATVVSDLSWQQSQGELVSDDIYKGEVRDMRKAQPAGWDTPDFDASSWAPAGPAVAPDGDLASAAYPPVRIANATLEARSVSRLGSGRWLFDFGVNTAALIRLELPSSTAGTSVYITTHEQLSKNGSGAGPYPSAQTFILAGSKGPVAVQTKMTYYGFQYLELVCEQWADAVPFGLKLTSLPVSTDVSTDGTITFKGDAAELLGKIHGATLNSGRSNLVSVPTDW